MHTRNASILTLMKCRALMMISQDTKCVYMILSSFPDFPRAPREPAREYACVRIMYAHAVICWITNKCPDLSMFDQKRTMYTLQYSGLIYYGRYHTPLCVCTCVQFVCNNPCLPLHWDILMNKKTIPMRVAALSRYFEHATPMSVHVLGPGTNCSAILGGNGGNGEYRQLVGKFR